MVVQGLLSLDALNERVGCGEIDTVLVCFPDMQGRLVGKRLHAPGAEEFANGWGDFGLVPDMASLRVLSWMPRTALVICDLVHLSGPEKGQPVAHSPRQMLKRQLQRLQGMGLQAQCATELEFYVFSGGYAHWHQQRHRDLRTHNHLNADYQIFQTQLDEPLMQRVRSELSRSGVLIEGSMGECSPGQQELNLRYTEALAFADAHALAGVEQGMSLPEAVVGNAYREGLPQIPRRMGDAIEVADGSAWLREDWGPTVVDHWVQAARWELAQGEQAITDWEIQRGFERC